MEYELYSAMVVIEQNYTFKCQFDCSLASCKYKI